GASARGVQGRGTEREPEGNRFNAGWGNAAGGPLLRVNPASPPVRRPPLGHARPCERRKASPSGVAWIISPRPPRCTRVTNRRSTASSQTGKRGHEVREASMTSAYDLGCLAIHSTRSATSDAFSIVLGSQLVDMDSSM